ncbi:hypothetical protein AJ78_08975 [Emergomyces pasteurianus Ep9510]|uniref:HNH nuclease domain-containing protein n=1 Tax=Emergomyces pasteurianus Ep9510 TaxID=1447872 RepID=A0A1J9P0E4_9EURO|nr:hypothetical protein AJ78_08975 [Emergomyces pasteurianus Ep9510]
MKKEIQKVTTTMNEPANRKNQCHLKKLCLKRDGHRCLVTGAIDINAKIPEADTEYVVPTDLCHIISFSLGSIILGLPDCTDLGHTEEIVPTDPA